MEPKHQLGGVWVSLLSVGEPLAVCWVIGKIIKYLNDSTSLGDKYGELTICALTVPLCAFGVASMKNNANRDRSTNEKIREFAYCVTVGSILALAVLISPWVQLLFKELNDSFMKDVFSTTFVHPKYGLGFVFMAVGITAYVTFQPTIHKLFFHL